ncbi:hypothetical protein H696_04646 [Fonticula alba]|uniref:Glutamate--cysteine ligase n=1 Tax=Fonticula alba TaxID=691883 RepID=A0A058Z4L2_FONAL|nr:hypothetical protein H696_04646 [Fonticula alba]KCV69229.1 hypothetical protein H696_04646 [Fonticula alba]|eukprot:XP_009496800.1 hypothetical protein H696_04646 [Fonticula alba]
MGLLSQGTPLDWADAVPHAESIRADGLTQVINVFKSASARKNDPRLWGDEIEGVLVNLDEQGKAARLGLRAGRVLDKLMAEEEDIKATGRTPVALWRPEYGRYMLECTPGSPYGPHVKDLLQVEPNMVARREMISGHLRPNERLLTITTFPRLGALAAPVSSLAEGAVDPGPQMAPEAEVAPFTEPWHPQHGDAAHSLFAPDELINTHPRFRTLTANIRQRRGAKVCVAVPVFRDTNTPWPFRDGPYPVTPHPVDGAPPADLPAGQIYMDSMCFGMGNCCLQTTFQASCIAEARRLYDQMIPLTPVLMAVSAAAPIWRGYLADIDCRWNQISASVDDRTRRERGLEPYPADGPAGYVIGKSRYGSVDSYLEASSDRFNDLPLVMNEPARERLEAAGVPAPIARHLAHLFIRDPLVLYRELLVQDNAHSTDHFENIQSTNWQTMRFKPPPLAPLTPPSIVPSVAASAMPSPTGEGPSSGEAIAAPVVNLPPPTVDAPKQDQQETEEDYCLEGPLGWRVEFRSLEVQFTEFENAAFAVFTALLARLIVEGVRCPTTGTTRHVDFRMPITLVDENLERAHRRGAVLTEKFHFRRDSIVDGDDGGSQAATSEDVRASPEDVAAARDLLEEQSAGRIVAETIIPLIRQYLDAAGGLAPEQRATLDRYLDLVAGRASGRYQTNAAWIRDFVRAHPAYKQDSHVSDEINFDLMRAISAISSPSHAADYPTPADLAAGLPALNTERLWGSLPRPVAAARFAPLSDPETSGCASSAASSTEGIILSAPPSATSRAAAATAAAAAASS